MRALQLTAANTFAVAIAPDPVPGPGQVLVRWQAAALNFRDVQVARGSYPNTAFPLIPGSDAAGTVEACGAPRPRQRKRPTVRAMRLAKQVRDAEGAGTLAPPGPPVPCAHPARSCIAAGYCQPRAVQDGTITPNGSTTSTQRDSVSVVIDTSGSHFWF